MAGVAGYLTSTVEIRLIDRKHHLHHLASGLLGFLVIFLEGIQDMTKFAFDSQGGRDEFHGWNELISRNSF